MELMKSLEIVLLSYCRRSTLKSPTRTTSYLLQSISEKRDSMYSINMTESVLGCLYIQPQIIYPSSVFDNSSILELTYMTTPPDADFTYGIPPYQH